MFKDFFRFKVKIFGDGIKGLQLRHCGKLNSTHHGKLQCRSRLYCGATVHEPQLTRESRVLRLVYCGSYISRAAVHERLFFFYLVYCGTLCTAVATVGIDAPQFESLYPVPLEADGSTAKLCSIT